VFGFNLAMTIQIGELLLAAIGATIHVVVALTIGPSTGSRVRPWARRVEGFSADERTCVADVGGASYVIRQKLAVANGTRSC